jgi:hypothetical protein
MDFGEGPMKTKSGVNASLRKRGVFGEKAITRMDCICSRPPCSIDYFFY